MTQQENRIIGHWSLIMFAKMKGSDIEVGTCKDSAGTEFPAMTFSDGKTRTFVGFGGSLEGGLTFDEICTQVEKLQVVELETSPETLARRKAKAEATGKPLQKETYKLCIKGETNWVGGNLFAALQKRVQ